MRGGRLRRRLGLDDRRLRVVQEQVIEVEELPLLGPIRGPQAGEVLLVGHRIEVVGVGDDRLHPEQVHVKLLALAVGAEALERPPRVGPVQRRDQPLRAEHQLLPAGAQVDGLLLDRAQLEFDEGVEQVALVGVDQRRR